MIYQPLKPDIESKFSLKTGTGNKSSITYSKPKFQKNRQIVEAFSRSVSKLFCTLYDSLCGRIVI